MTASVPTAPRLPLVDTPDDPMARELFGKLAAGRGILNLHRTMAHAPVLLKASGDMAMAFRNDAVLPRSTAEIVVLRTSQIVDCDYIWKRHVSLAEAAGVSARQMSEVADWRESSAFTPAQKIALGFAEHAARVQPIDDSAFAALRKEFSAREIVELTMLVGLYVSTAILLKSLAVPDEKE